MAFGIDVDALWRRARLVAFLGALCYLPTHEDHLFLLALHRAKEQWHKLKWVVDVPALLASHPRLDLVALRATAAAQGCGRMLDLALLLTHRLFAIPAAAPSTDRVVADLADRGRIVVPLAVARAAAESPELRHPHAVHTARCALPPPAIAPGAALAARAAETAVGPRPDASDRSRASDVPTCTLMCSVPGAGAQIDWGRHGQRAAVGPRPGCHECGTATMAQVYCSYHGVPRAEATDRSPRTR